MPMNKSMEKRLRQLRKATARNRTYRSRMRTAIRQAREAADEKADNLSASLSEAQKLIDKAAKAHAIHHKTAARIKSRLMKQIGV
jgi:small subunit ribosomal protein S20